MGIKLLLFEWFSLVNLTQLWNLLEVEPLLLRYTQIISHSVENIGYRDRIGWEFFVLDIEYRGRYQGYARISGVHIRHYI